MGVLIATAAACDDPYSSGSGPVEALWSLPNDRGSYYLAITEEDGTLAILLRGAVAGVDAEAGSVRWRTASNSGLGSYAPGGLLVKDGTVYGAGDIAFALDAADGSIEWTFPLPAGRATTSNGVVWGSTLIVPTTDDALLAMNATTGTLLWNEPLGASRGYDVRPKGVTLSGDTIFVGGSSATNSNGSRAVGWVGAYDASDGHALWFTTFGGPDDRRTAIGPPTIAEGRVYVSDVFQNRVVAFDMATGDILWDFAGAPDGVGPAMPPVYYEGRVYVASADRYVYALDAATGAVAWKRMYGSSHRGIVLCNELLAVGEETVTFLEPSDGALVAEARMPGDYVTGFLSAHDGIVYAPTSESFMAFPCPD